MNLKNKLYFLFIFLSLVFINNVNAIELIIPKSKPINSELDKLTDNILPLKKPSLKVGIKLESKKNDLTQKTEYLLPKKKPINNELNKLTDNIVPLKKPSLKVEIKPEFEKN